MKIISTITFFYKENRLSYLKQVIESHWKCDKSIDIFILTNTQDSEELEKITSLQDFHVNIVSFTNLPNPWYLTWAHKQVMRENINKGYTHFLHTEDDIKIYPHNINYWLESRSNLRKFNLYPSLIRIEWSNFSQNWVSTDLLQQVSISQNPVLHLEEEDLFYMNFGNSYQGMFLYDKELMVEHLSSKESDVYLSVGIQTNLPPTGGGVAEQANYGLTFKDVPDGFRSRSVVRFFKELKMLDPCCFVHHLPNNYANNPEQSHGKILIYKALIN